MISREDLVEQSVFDFAQAAVFDERGYPMDKVEFRENFPYRLNDAFIKTIVAAGFNFDDGGQQAECGSDLKRRLYTIQFFVFGQTATWGRNLANVIKFALDKDGLIPLRDYSQQDAPVIDQLLVHDDPGPSAERQIIPDPEPWQEFCWTVTLRVVDEYRASLV